MSEKKGPSNTLGDLNNFLFAQLERLDNPDLEGDELLKEIARSKAMSEISKNIIELLIFKDKLGIKEIKRNIKHYLYTSIVLFIWTVKAAIKIEYKK